MNKKIAQILALKACEWILASSETREAFLSLTGQAPAQIAERLEDHAFLVAVLDFIMLQDDWVFSFCDSHQFDYSLPQSARALLSGEYPMNWT